MTARTNTEVDHSRWPVWVAKRSDDWDNWLLITCPRCEGQALVNRQRWYKATKYTTRTCPYCFKANKLPKPRDIGRRNT
jgi:hypothetical protein